MKKNRHEFGLRVCTAAVQAALLGFALARAGAAWAEDSGAEVTAAELTTPTQSVEIGGGDVSADSQKAGEYDGLNRKGGFGIGNIDLRGGGSYDSNDPTRWSLWGTDLGLETRDIQVEYGKQGKYRWTFGYDELMRAGSAMYDSMQSPYLGVGTTSLTLPGNWKAPLYTTSAAMAGTAPTNNYPAPSATMLGLAATSYGSPLVANTAFLCKSTTNGCGPNAAFGGAYTTRFPVTAANTAMLAQNQTDLSDFQAVRLSTKREKQNYGVTYELDPRWNLVLGMQREDKKGIKPLGVVNAGNGGYGAENAVTIPELIDTTTDQYNASVNFRGEKSFFTAAYYGSIFDNNAKSMTVANPYAVGTYNGVTQNAYGLSSATISEEPNSTFNQFRLTGGYDLTKSMRLVADAAYGRNTQNDSFVLDQAMFATPTGAAGAAVNNGSVVPGNSANALVVTESFDLKLTARPAPKWNLDAAYKYDDRNNETGVNNYVWYDAGAKNFGAPNSVLNGATVPGVPAGTPLYSGVNVTANRPYSKKVNQFDADADYAFARGQSVKVGFDWQAIDRNCSGSWIDCSFADKTREATGKLEYRYTGGGTLSGRVGYDYGNRHVDYNNNAWMALNPALAATNIPSLGALGNNGSVLGFLNANGLTPYGLPIAANANSGFTGNTLAIYQLLYGTGNGGLSNNYYGNHNVTQNWPGLDVYNMADRTRQRVRGALDWQASETFTLQTGADYRHDNYPDSTYGLKNSTNWSLNFDADMKSGDDLSFDAFYTHEDQKSTSAGNSASNGPVNVNAATGTAYTTATGATGTNTAVAGLCAGDSTAGLTNPTQFQIYNNNLKIDSCTGWQSDMHDHTDTVGLAFNKKHLITPKFSLSGDVSYSRSVTSNTMTGGFYYTNTLAPYVAGAPAVIFINAAALPDVVVSSEQLRLVGGYQLTKASTVRVAYTFKHLQTNDYQYATTLPAYTSGSVMPAFAPSPDYSVSVIGVSYVYQFQ
ncbi:exported hypothetical protein [Burkholderiales bacterium]|nr:exported hypothetical protein [Burkholderiales bacterium]